jgi:hypothetical protein
LNGNYPRPTPTSSAIAAIGYIRSVHLSVGRRTSMGAGAAACASGRAQHLGSLRLVVAPSASCYYEVMKNRRASAKRSTIKSTALWYCGLALVLVLAYFLGGRLQPGQERYLYYDPDRLPPGTIHFIKLPLRKGNGMYLINDDGTVRAIVATDPYDRCRVSWHPVEQIFISPCSGSQYGVDGSYIKGSAAGGLEQFVVLWRHGNIVIDTETRIPGAPRSDQADD